MYTEYFCINGVNNLYSIDVISKIENCIYVYVTPNLIILIKYIGISMYIKLASYSTSTTWNV